MPLYLPRQFREERPEVLAAAVEKIQFAALVTPDDEGVQVTHLPLRLKVAADGAWTLEGHVARPNAHWKAASNTGKKTVAIFQGPHAYISPSHYATKRETGKVVPTWAYIVVHAHGVLEAIDDPAWLLGHVGEMTDANEQARADPWGVGDAPNGFVENMTRAIVGLRLPVARIDGKWKLNQHRSEADRHGTIEGLSHEADGAPAVSDAMRAAEKVA